MQRRDFITLLGGAVAAWPIAARAQNPARVRRIGVLMGTAATEQFETYLATFLSQLEALGWKRADNARIEVRWWTGSPEQMQTVVAELLAFAPDVIMVFSNLALAVLKPMVGNLPVVFVGVGDPVGEGFVANLARPGGNITGFSGYESTMGGKWLEVLKQTAPHLTRVMTVFHPETPIHRAFWRSAEAAAPRVGVEVTPAGVHDAAEIERAISSIALNQNSGIIVPPHAITWANDDLIIALALRHRLPAIFSTDGSVTAGGLVSYGYNLEQTFRNTAGYVDRILRGEKPSDLPVQQPTKFKLAFNLKTAKVLGVTIPESFLLQADEVIE